MIEFQEAMKREKSPVDFSELESDDEDSVDTPLEEEPLNKKARTICPFTRALEDYCEHFYDCGESVEDHPFRRPVYQALMDEALSLTIPYKAETGMYQFECK